MTADIIQFPTKVPEGEVPPSDLSEEELGEKVIADSHDLANVVVAELLNLGYNVLSDPDMHKDICMVFESIKSTMAKTVNLSHPIQDFADVCFERNGESIIFREPKFKVCVNEPTDGA